MAGVTATIYLDTVHKKKNGKFPVKLKIYYVNERKYYPVYPYSNQPALALTQDEYNSIYLSRKVRKEHTSLNAILRGILSKAEETIISLKSFSFGAFEKKFFGVVSNRSSIGECYNRYIDKLDREKSFGTKDNYRLSLKSIQDFALSVFSKNEIGFQDITPDFLNGYEAHMLKKGRSITTVGIYLRPLRSIFNTAIQEEDIDKDLYPFGKGKYQIPTSRKVKKALNEKDLEAFYFAKTESGSHQEKARDFWFFSYFCNGMNMADIAALKYKNIQEDTLTFIRTKTKNTTRTDLIPIAVHLSTFAKKIIEKYGNLEITKDTFVFPIYDPTLNHEENFTKRKAFTRFVNQHIKILAKDNDITSDLSTNWGRHSFTTISIQNGASMELMRESLGHTDMKTTQNYMAGFGGDARKDLSDKLLNFTKEHDSQVSKI